MDQLLERADILIHNVPPNQRTERGLDSAQLLAKYPRLIATSISMFGDTGPYANYKAYEVTASNAGGWANLSPGASPYPDLPPLKCFGSQCDFQGGAHAAFTSLAAWLYRLKSGKGQSIDVSEQETIVAMLEMNLTHYTYAKREASRLGQRLLGPWFIADCSDGKIFCLAVEEDQWKRLVELMGNPEWAQDELFKDRLSRGANMDALKALMSDWISGWKTQELYQAAQKNRIPFAPINTMKDLYESPHLRERGFFTQFEQPGVGRLNLPGMPSRYGVTKWSLRRPAPRLGEHSEEIFCGELGVTRIVLTRCGRPGLPDNWRITRWLICHFPEFEYLISPGPGRDRSALCNWRIWARRSSVWRARLRPCVTRLSPVLRRRRSRDTIGPVISINTIRAKKAS